MNRVSVYIVMLIVFLPVSAHANGAVFRSGADGGLQVSKVDNIKMISEDVIFDASNIVLSDYSRSLEAIPVRCLFRLKNISGDIVNIKMGFPFNKRFIRFAEDTLNIDFQTVINNKEYVEVAKNVNNGVYSVVYTWNVFFLPYEEKYILCKYNGFADASSADGTGESWSFRYITHTGGYWSSAIDTAKFTFIVPRDVDGYLNKGMVRIDGFNSYKQRNHDIQPRGYNKSGDALHWAFINWLPDTMIDTSQKKSRSLTKDDFNITFTSHFSADLHEYFMMRPYHGDDSIYGEKDLETPFTQDQFQTEAEPKTIEYLHLLRNEIFARKGYIFKDSTLNDFFARTTWYKPQPQGMPPLNPIEKENIKLILAADKAYKIGIAEIEQQTIERYLGQVFLEKFEHKAYTAATALYDKSVLSGLYANEKWGRILWLQLLRNEIYARHGLIFRSKRLASFFSSLSWYKPSVASVIDLNKNEIENVMILRKLEEMQH